MKYVPHSQVFLGSGPVLMKLNFVVALVTGTASAKKGFLTRDGGQERFSGGGGVEL